MVFPLQPGTRRGLQRGAGPPNRECHHIHGDGTERSQCRRPNYVCWNRQYGNLYTNNCSRSWNRIHRNDHNRRQRPGRQRTGSQTLSGRFTTGATPDLTKPTLIAVSPVLGATGVPINQAVSATFSKGMDPLTLNSTTFTLTGPGGTPVVGTVGYDALNPLRASSVRRCACR